LVAPERYSSTHGFHKIEALQCEEHFVDWSIQERGTTANHIAIFEILYTMQIITPILPKIHLHPGQAHSWTFSKRKICDRPVGLDSIEDDVEVTIYLRMSIGLMIRGLSLSDLHFAAI
jgi:hypothetical protein